MSTVKKIILFVLLSGFGSCVSDSSDKANGVTIISEAENSAAKKFIQDKYGQQIPTLKVDLKIPRKEDWTLSREISLDNFNPIGITYHMDKVFVSDTVQKLVLAVELSDEKIDTILQDCKATYLNRRRAKLLMPIADRDSIFVYRGTQRGLYKFQIPEKLNRPSSFDGFKILDHVIVDQGNNRLVRTQEDGLTIIGGFGNKNGQFDNPTVAHILGNNIHVSDTGNKRMQIFSFAEGKFVRTYGENDRLSAPTGLTSDGKNLFVCDSGSGTICLYSNEGKLLYKITEGLEAPSDIYFDEGQLYVSDTKSSTIKIFTNEMYN